MTRPEQQSGGQVDVREGDVFRFCYSEEWHAKLFEPHHCFDGQLVAAKWGEGIVLFDTYWMHGFVPRGDHGKRFTVEEAQAKGELTFVCNLHEVEQITEHDSRYYDDSDVFNLSYQHRCYPYFALRKGAAKSREKMLAVLDEQRQEADRQIRSATHWMERIAESVQMVEDGRMAEVYL